ncbi:MAG: FAD-dependent oxidoreductase [Acidobacteria bacterium]|nr:FAD-dependent oxidoreductase [Acidobacteriota bacterium]
MNRKRRHLRQSRWIQLLAIGACCVTGLYGETAGGNHTLLDAMRVSAEGDAAQALVTPAAGPVRQVRCDIVIVGAGLGGVSAALAAGDHSVCMTEPTMWVGGQATSQGVSAFDDNKWINTTGGTTSYLALSNSIRRHYAAFRRDTSQTVEQSISIQGPMSNPGGCWVGRLCFEPEPTAKILMDMLEPSVRSGRVQLWLHTVPVEVTRRGATIRSVLAYDFERSQWLRLEGRYFIEASELGNFLRLSGLPFRTGAESQAETHERDAPAQADPHAAQSFTYPFIFERRPSPEGTDEPKPPAYESFLKHYSLTIDYGHGKLLTYGVFEARPKMPGSFWVYRRSIDASRFNPQAFPYDRSMINWNSNDHCDANLLGDDPLLQARALQDGKRASLGFAWWIRHAVPRDDHSGAGYPELAVLPHAMGTSDGLSQHPYIRESRRIVPLRTIVEEDLAVDFQPGSRAAHYPDSVGIGWYPIDIHSCEHKDFTSQTRPYEIPLGALIARDATNLMAVGKTIGATHITNGAYRLHPTEWSTGEAAGATLAWSLDHAVTPRRLDADPSQLAKLQRELVQRGHPVFWYDDVPVDSEDFAAMQMGGARHWWAPDSQTLHGNPESPVTKGEIASPLHIQASPDTDTAQWDDLRRAGERVGSRSGTITRRELASWMLERMDARSGGRPGNK